MRRRKKRCCHGTDAAARGDGGQDSGGRPVRGVRRAAKAAAEGVSISTGSLPPVFTDSVYNYHLNLLWARVSKFRVRLDFLTCVLVRDAGVRESPTTYLFCCCYKRPVMGIEESRFVENHRDILATYPKLITHDTICF